MFMLNPKLLAEAFPINKIEIFFDNEDHSSFLGFQWEMVSQGKMPIGLNTSDTDFNSIGKTGGEKEVTLTVDQIPPHSHQARVSSIAGSDETITRGTTKGVWRSLISSAGGGQAHNNMPPYIVMAFWKRVA